MMNRKQASAAYALLSRINLRYADKEIKLNIVRNVTRLKPIVTATGDSEKEMQTRIFTEDLTAKIEAYNAKVKEKDMAYLSGEGNSVRDEIEAANGEMTTLLKELHDESVAVDIIPMDTDKLLEAMDKSEIDYNAEDIEILECLFGKMK